MCVCVCVCEKLASLKYHVQQKTDNERIYIDR